MTWDHRDTDSLIEMFREARPLWDIDNPHYRNRAMINKIYKSMAKRFNKSTYEIKAKLKSLRCMFQRQYKKVKEAQEKCVKLSRSNMWCGYKSMAFLEDAYDKKACSTTIEELEDQSETMELYEEINLDEEFPEQSDDDASNGTDLMWTREDVVRLIDMYKEQSILWDIDHPNYHHKQMRLKALKLIAENFETSIPEIKNKLKNLRTMLMHMHKKVKAAIETDGKFTGKLWYGYKKLDFLIKDGLPELDEERVITNDKPWSKEFENIKGSDTEENPKTVWHQQLFLNLINVYKDHSLLWDSEHEDYNNKSARNGCIRNIAQILSKPPREVESKIKNLRTQFFKNHKKIQEIIKTEGKITGKVWFGYKPMRFLLTASQMKKDRDVQEEGDNIKKEPFHCEDDDVHDIDESHDSNDDDADSHVSTNSNEMLQLDQTVKHERKRKYSDSCSDDPLEFISNKKKMSRSRSKNENAKTEDEYTVFGQFITQELRKIKDDYVLMMTKKQLSDIVFQAQIQQASASNTKVFLENRGEKITP